MRRPSPSRTSSGFPTNFYSEGFALGLPLRPRLDTFRGVSASERRPWYLDPSEVRSITPNNKPRLDGRAGKLNPEQAT
jgi:hypothetical protein